MSLCLTCGLCCDGTLFKVARLEPDEVVRLEGRVNVSADGANLVQPCRALDGCSCGIYADRPAACRAFRCLVLASLEAGLIDDDQARAAIGEVLERRALLAQLLGMEDVREAWFLGKRQLAEGTASPEVKEAASSLAQALLLLQVLPS